MYPGHDAAVMRRDEAVGLSGFHHEAVFYASMTDKAVVGIMRIAREAQPDPKDADWVSVSVEPVRAIGPVTLKDIKAEPKLAKMELIRQSRLSVAPVREGEWETLLKMAG